MALRQQRLYVYLKDGTEFHFWVKQTCNLRVILSQFHSWFENFRLFQTVSDCRAQESNLFRCIEQIMSYELYQITLHMISYCLVISIHLFDRCFRTTLTRLPLVRQNKRVHVCALKCDPTPNLKLTAKTEPMRVWHRLLGALISISAHKHTQGSVCLKNNNLPHTRLCVCVWWWERVLVAMLSRHTNITPATHSPSQDEWLGFNVTCASNCLTNRIFLILVDCAPSIGVRLILEAQIRGFGRLIWFRYGRIKKPLLWLSEGSISKSKKTPEKTLFQSIFFPFCKKSILHAKLGGKIWAKSMQQNPAYGIEVFDVV